jgi:hypothetical protein
VRVAGPRGDAILGRASVRLEEAQR